MENIGKHQEEEIRNEIIEVLDEDPQNEEYIIKQLSLKHNKNLLSEFFKILINLEIPEEEAQKCLKEIIKHKQKMTITLKRNIGFRVALLDYFVNINKQLVNPKIIEIKIFEATAKLALLDELTMLYNRRFFNNCLEKEFSRAKRHKQCLSLFLFDIDDFKAINDNHSHIMGDKVLAAIGQTLMQNIRREDFACRYGGEEFILVLPETHKEGALELAIRIKEAIALISIGNINNITISGGISTFPLDTDNTSDLLLYADKMMYKAKFGGKNNIISYSK